MQFYLTHVPFVDDVYVGAHVVQTVADEQTLQPDGHAVHEEAADTYPAPQVKQNEVELWIKHPERPVPVVNAPVDKTYDVAVLKAVPFDKTA